MTDVKIAIASCRALPEPDPDEPLLLAKLEASGAKPSLLAWDDPEAPFADHDLVVLRSTWNYFEDVDAFLAWIDRTAARTPILNPPSVVRMNARKTYLRDLDERGIAIVPTRFVMRGEHRDVAALVHDEQWASIVVKPVVSAGSFQTKRFSTGEWSDAQRFLDELSAERDMMVQRWMPSVETYGERSLVWIEGELTHAIRKSPRLAGGVESVSDEIPIADEERAFAERVLAPFASSLPLSTPTGIAKRVRRGASDLLYGRVDVVRDETGVLRVMELELIEPSLFFAQCPRALERFVAAISARHARGRAS